MLVIISLLRLKLTMSDTTAGGGAAGGINVNLCENCDCLFRRLEAYQGSSVLEQVD